MRGTEISTFSQYGSGPAAQIYMKYNKLENGGGKSKFTNYGCIKCIRTGMVTDLFADNPGLQRIQFSSHLSQEKNWIGKKSSLCVCLSVCVFVFDVRVCVANYTLRSKPNL